MSNPMLARLLGESGSGDVVPVLANVPRQTFIKRMAKQKPQDEDDSVKRMVGEAREDEEVIPDDAQDVDSHEMTVGKPLRAPKEVVQEPSHPAGNKEKYQTPYAALTAPDVTPQSTQPIDPSQVPGSKAPEKFTAADLERATPVTGGEDPAVKAMDTLLGRNRAAKPATQPGEFEQAGAITTEAQALAALGIQPIHEESHAKAANLLVAAAQGGGAMPAPAPVSDGAAVYSAFRRFNG